MAASDSPPISLDEAVNRLFDKAQGDSGKYYGAVHRELGLGVGLIYSGIAFPVYDAEKQQFVMFKGSALVLTHECDIEVSSDKVFNQDVLVLPLVPFEDVYNAICASRKGAEVGAYIGDLAAGRISQLVYLPPWPKAWPHGIVLYLNRISHTHITEFQCDGVVPIGTLTTHGMYVLQDRLSHHLFREKVDRLPAP